ncbi:RcnB family protein [Sphingomonas sp. 37zxx]|uniref:RcnB family protein n=1 Tax=Sphingomonas sp. 37zxx TaxID=1550073 RepID=UPI0006909666|nr:RcnB family protein [Sphingomonas sp. 37zxx]
MMNKWMGALLAATALIPATAMAQDGNRREGRQQQRAERQVMRVQPQTREVGNLNIRAQRQDGGERPAVRQERPAQRLSDPVQREQFVRERQAVQVQRESNRADRQVNGQPMRSELRRQDAAPQRQAFRDDRQDDRGDFRDERRVDRDARRGGVVTQPQFRADRNDARQDFRRDRADDRRDFDRDGRNNWGRNNWGSNNWGNNNWGRDNWGGNSWNNNRAYAGNRGGWNRGWRNDNRYDWRGYRQVNRNVFRLPRYYAPTGYRYGYQRFGIGVTLGSILFAQDYWIADPWAYRLPPIDGPFRWVRYYNDALLVDLASGQVVDVEHDIFW